ncbi:MAG: ATPase, T2SS/T4P/T4SS family, partial [Candidatus Cloacimonadaceae bacterium]|nr:ATPase, T2SS/T4P/T4SS family [Candidatus Cloacimonadaceae bacterium]
MAVLNKFGKYLVENGYFDIDLVNRATLKMDEYGENSASSLARVMELDFLVPHDKIYEALAKLYAFPQMRLDLEELTDAQINGCKEILKKFPEDFKKKLFYNKIFPLSIQDGNRDALILLVSDPTHKLIHEIASNTPYKKTEVYWSPQKTIEDLINRIAPQQNEFLQLLEEAGQVLVEMDKKDDDLNEQALDEEINKSLLVNLFEGVLIEAVRRDASDVHIIPSGKTSIDIFIRVDGKLQLWHRQESTAPEALSAVVKDRSIGVDRFERDTAQDGFAQRMVDEHLIRFRISILPIVSQEFERRFESIVIRVIDDRKVITDFRKLGFQEQAQNEFL